MAKVLSAPTPLRVTRDDLETPSQASCVCTPSTVCSICTALTIETKPAPGKWRRFSARLCPRRRFESRRQCDSIFFMSAVSAVQLEKGSTSTVEAPVRETETREEEELDVPWQVVVHNDPVNLMSYVTMVFQRVFGYPREKAEVHMLEVHHKGRSILWSGAREPAEFYVQQLHGYLLLATLEKIV